MTAAQPYIAVSRRPLDLEDYISVARRHSGWIIGPLFAGLVVSIVVAFCWPNTYEARAVMQITPSRVVETIAPSMLTQQLTDRILQMEANITSRQSLANLIQDPHLNLYKEERAKEPLDDVEDQMRQDIRITVNPEMALSRKGASNFQISFSYRSRKGAVDTVNNLISRFIQESSTTQHDQQETIQSLVSDEVSTSHADLEKQEEALSKFRKDNEGRLPEQEQMNIASLNSLMNELTGVNQDLQRLANERSSIESEINLADNSLKLNQSMAQEIADMGPVSSVMAHQNDELAGLNKTIETDQLKLQQLKQQYKSTYPDIRYLESNLKVLQTRRDEILAKQNQDEAADEAKPKPAQKKTTNFKAIEAETAIKNNIERYQQMLKVNENNREARLKQQADYNKQIAAYRDRLAQTSLLEAPYQDLKRDYTSAQENYEKFRRQKDMTTQSAELISRKATEYLDTLDPPSTPQKPINPKRGLIVGAGAAISLILGFALAGLQEARDASLKNLKDVRAYTNLPVLCSIPLLENTLLVKRKRRITYLAWSAAGIVGILAVSLALFYYYTVIANT